MLSPLIRIARLVRKRRIALRFSQREVARQVGCNQSYLAQIETGRRPISKQLAEKLEVLFRVQRGSYTSVTFLRGRPRLSEQARHILRQIRKAKGKAAMSLPHGRSPKYPRPARRPGLENPLWPIGMHLGEEAAAERRRRPNGALPRDFFVSLPGRREAHPDYFQQTLYLS